LFFSCQYLTLLQARLVANFKPPHAVTYANSPWWNLRGYESQQQQPNYQNKSLEEVLVMQLLPLHSRHNELVIAILSCIPQVCRGIPTRIHWVYSSPGNGSTVLAYLKLIPIANENLETSQFLLILYEFKLPPYHSVDPFQILLEPVINPKLPDIPTQNMNTSSSSESSFNFLPQRTQDWEQMGFDMERTTSRSRDRNCSDSVGNLDEKENFVDSLPVPESSSKPETRRRRSHR
jgi:hypothetical protein